MFQLSAFTIGSVSAQERQAGAVRAQYAGKIEAAHAQLGEKETTGHSKFERLKENLDTVQQEVLLQKKESAKMSANWSEAKQAAVNLVSTHKLAMDEQQKNHSMMIRRLEENLN